MAHTYKLFDLHAIQSLMTPGAKALFEAMDMNPILDSGAREVFVGMITAAELQDANATFVFIGAASNKANDVPGLYIVCNQVKPKRIRRVRIFLLGVLHTLKAGC